MALFTRSGDVDVDVQGSSVWGAPSGAPSSDFLCEVIRELSGTQDLCEPSDNYFDLGMDSLLLVDLKDRIESRFGVKIRVSDFFTHFTVAGLAAVVDRRRAQEGAVLSGAGTAAGDLA